MGTGTGGIPTTDNIPEKTEIFGCPTDNIPEKTEIFYYFYISNIIKLGVLKNRLSGIFSVRHPSFSVVSGILSVGHPNISVFSGILSVVGIPPVPVPIPEGIQLLMYVCR
jgi:hypothetical protein